MSADPPVPADGSCVVCGGLREPNRSRKYGRAEAERDPFCSTQCCREWYGTTLVRPTWGDVTRATSRTKLRKSDPQSGAVAPQSPSPSPSSTAA